MSPYLNTISLSKLTITLVTAGQYDIGECKNNHPYSSIKHSLQPQQRKSYHLIITDESQASSMFW
jgi:hypothetical protein